MSGAMPAPRTDLHATRAGAFGTLVAVILTFNRRDIVIRCIDAVLAQQGGAPDLVLVLDNGSSDGTAEALTERYRQQPVRLLRLDKNIGAAAGFDTLTREAYKLGHDWIWIMDDDAIPDPDALAALKRAYLDHFSSPAELGYLISYVVSPSGKGAYVPTLDERPSREGMVKEWAELLADGMVRVRMSTLNSLLLPRTTLDIVDGICSDFIIWGEDIDFTVRITQRRPAFLVGGSRVVHLKEFSGESHILKETDPRRLGNFYYWYRNSIYITRVFHPTPVFFVCLMGAAQNFFKCLTMRQRPFYRASLVLRGTLAGLFFRPRYVPFSAERPSAVRIIAGDPAAQPRVGNPEHAV